MANLSVARPPRQSRFSGLGWRRARWGYVFIAPWLIGFLAFTAIPMIATLAFSFTNINLAQAEPLTFVGLKNYEKLLKDQQVWDSLAITLKFAAHRAARGGHPAAPRGAHAPFPAPVRRGRLPGPVLPALRRAVRGRRLHLGRDAQPEHRLDQPGPPGGRCREPAGVAGGSRRGSTPALRSSGSGASARG